MPSPTKAILDSQSDLKRSTAPFAGVDVTNKTYVDAAVAAATIPDATSANGGGVKGKATFDDLKGLHVTAGIAEVKIDGSTVTFNGSGQLQSAASTPTATSAPGGGTQGKVTADENKGLKIVAGIMEVFNDPNGGLQSSPTGHAVKPDPTGGLQTAAAGASVKPDPAGALATSGAGLAAVVDGTRGMQILANKLAAKVDGTSIDFDGSGNLKVVGGTGGGTTGLVSNRASFARAIVGGPSMPPSTVLGTQTSADAYPDGSTTGERFEFTVPDDYFTGNLDILIVYKMSTAVGGPNNKVRITTAAELAKVTGLIDSATYPTTAQTITTPTTTNITRIIALTLTSGTFEAGDVITVSIQRLGADGLDLHTGDWQVIAYEWRYTAIVNSRLVTQVPETLQNAAGENATASGVLGSQTDFASFPTTPDSGARFTGIVPDNWDGFSDCFISLVYAMSTAVGGANVKLNKYGEIADVGGGTLASIPSTDFTFSPPGDTDIHRVVVGQIPATLLTKGDWITAVLARRTAVGGNHTGAFRLLAFEFLFSVAPASGFTQNNITERYLDKPVFGNIVGTITNTDAYPLFGSTFDELFTMSSTSAAGRVDAAFAGRLGSFQTQITQVRVNIIGTGASPQYHLKVYAEGTGLVYDSGLQPAPLTLTELLVTGGMLSAQPTTMKRFHVVVESFIDAGESVAVSYPFVRQE